MPFIRCTPLHTFKKFKGFLFCFSLFFFCGIHLKHEDKILSSLLSFLVSQNSMLNLSLQQKGRASTVDNGLEQQTASRIPFKMQAQSFHRTDSTKD